MMSCHFSVTILVCWCQITSYYRCYSVFDWHIEQIDSQFHHQIRFVISLFCVVHHVVFRVVFMMIHRDSVIHILHDISTSYFSRISSIFACFHASDALWLESLIAIVIFCALSWDYWWFTRTCDGSIPCFVINVANMRCLVVFLVFISHFHLAQISGLYFVVLHVGLFTLADVLMLFGTLNRVLTASLSNLRCISFSYSSIDNGTTSFSPSWVLTRDLSHLQRDYRCQR